MMSYTAKNIINQNWKIIQQFYVLIDQDCLNHEDISNICNFVINLKILIQEINLLSLKPQQKKFLLSQKKYILIEYMLIYLILFLPCIWFISIC